VNPKFLAEIQLNPAEQNGRAGPLIGGEWRTILSINGENWSARLFFAGSPEPGDSFRADVQLLMPEAYERFQVGAEFTVWENGTKGIGHVIAPAT
jgi:hypothetical protein